MSRLLGQSIGISVVAVIFNLAAHGGVNLHSIRIALLFGAATSIISAGILCTAHQPHLRPE
jgi:hypothetical protein